jgi:hypothetical protein
MKMVQRLPKYHPSYIMPNEMITYCGYTCGKMTVNEASMEYQWRVNGESTEHQWCLNRQSMECQRSINGESMQHQWSINNFWPYIILTMSGDWLQPFINVVLAGFIGETGSNTLLAPFWE